MSIFRFADAPIGRKLVLVGVAGSGVALAVSGAFFLYATLVALRANVSSQIDVQSSIVADNSAASLAFHDPNAAAETLGALKVADYIEVACLYDEVERVAAYHATGSADVCPDRAPPDSVVVDAATRIVRPVEFRGRRHGTLYMKGNFHQVRRRFVEQAAAALVGILLGVAAAVLLATRLQRLISRPIVELSSTATRIAQAGDYSLRAPRQSNDEIGELVATFNNMVAEVERRDEQVRNTSRLKDEFLASLSHELRTPLNAVMGWTQVLRLDSCDKATADQALAGIERNARAQATLIDDLLDVSSLVTGTLRVHVDEVDLRATIDAALAGIQPALLAKRITLSQQLLPSPQWVQGDPKRLHQVAWKLLSNAVKFTGQDGHIAIALTVDGGNYAFEVRDDGVGISATLLPAIFDRFRHVDGAGAMRERGGLGLGLSIARDLVEMHGGRVTAASGGPGLGATFRVTLPRRGDHPQSHE